jgi:hypothetical protein
LAAAGCLPPRQNFRRRGRARSKCPRDPGQRKRKVVLELRYGAVEIRRPRAERDRSLPPSMRLRMVEVREARPRA